MSDKKIIVYTGLFHFLKLFFFLSSKFEKFQEASDYKLKQAELQVMETKNQRENAELSLKNEIQSWQKKLHEEEEVRHKVHMTHFALV